VIQKPAMAGLRGLRRVFGTLNPQRESRSRSAVCSGLFLHSSDSLAICPSNAVSQDLDGNDDYSSFDSTFIFHEPHGEATLVFLAKMPDPYAHRDIFWSTPSAIAETPDRFHLNVNPGGKLALDYREGNGTPHTILALDNNSVFLDLDQWTTIAIVRTVDQQGGHLYEVYKNGSPMT
jgi:hypothetical protein